MMIKKIYKQLDATRNISLFQMQLLLNLKQIQKNLTLKTLESKSLTHTAAVFTSSQSRVGILRLMNMFVLPCTTMTKLLELAV